MSTKKKTALQQLIHKYENICKPTDGSYMIFKGFAEDLKTLLQTEREQIMDAWNNGYRDGEDEDRRIDTDPPRPTSEQYFTNTYEQ